MGQHQQSWSERCRDLDSLEAYWSDTHSSKNPSTSARLSIPLCFTSRRVYCILDPYFTGLGTKPPDSLKSTSQTLVWHCEETPRLNGGAF